MHEAGFRPDDLLPEVRSAHAYRDLTGEQWQWCLDFVRQGGPSLTAYPDFRRVAPDDDGVWRVPDARQVALRYQIAGKRSMPNMGGVRCNHSGRRRRNGDRASRRCGTGIAMPGGDRFDTRALLYGRPPRA